MKKIKDYKYWYNIVKYRPDGYGPDGYVPDEWTDFTDIGDPFNGKALSLAEYLRVETQYVRTVSDILKAIGCKYVTITARMVSFNADFFLSNLLFGGSQKIIESSRLGQRVSVDRLEPYIRLSLRNVCFFVFANTGRNFKLEIDDCFYMRIYTRLKYGTLKKIANQNGLHVLDTIYFTEYE